MRTPTHRLAVVEVVVMEKDLLLALAARRSGVLGGAAEWDRPTDDPAPALGELLRGCDVADGGNPDGVDDVALGRGMGR